MNIEADMMVTAQYGSQTRQYVLASVRLWSFKGVGQNNLLLNFVNRHDTGLTKIGHVFLKKVFR